MGVTGVTLPLFEIKLVGANLVFALKKCKAPIKGRSHKDRPYVSIDMGKNAPMPINRLNLKYDQEKYYRIIVERDNL